MRLLGAPGGAAWAWMDSTGAEVVYVALVLAWGLWRGLRRELLLGIIAVALADPIASRLLKPVFERERPCQVDPAVRQAQAAVHLGCRSSASLPSSHAANSAALAAALAAPPLVAGAALVGLSRVVDGQHYPTDVLAGWALGAAVGATVRRVAGRWLLATSPPPV